jgi:uncharacterized protein
MTSRILRAWRPLALVAVFSVAQSAAGDEPPARLQAVAFHPLPLGSVRPSGWLKGQLRTQADGLSGHLDEYWPDIKESAWFGGKAEGWERVPYWLDGVVPLAFLTDDAPLKARVKKAVDYILDHQHPDGWFGPVGDSQKHKPYDVWPLFPLFKALTQYQEATGDPRVVPALLKAVRKVGEVIGKEPMYSWARFRAADLVVTLYWLYDHTGGKEPWLLELANTARTQAHDWRAQYEAGKFPEKTVKAFGLDSHGVNNGMALKAPGVWWRLTGNPKDRDAVFRMFAFLDEHHGQANGLFTCDEHLAGRSPSQGTELCTVVEAMYSLETLLSIQGDPALGDRLETLAFDALPATFRKDMTAHQYDQQANQVVCKVSRDHVYVNNGDDSNTYGLEPNFGCCTANLHQGWPKFTESLWMRSPDGGLAAVALAPCTVAAKVDGKAVTVDVTTDYPFRDTVSIVVKPGDAAGFPLRVRIPGWASGAMATVKWEPSGLRLPGPLSRLQTNNAVARAAPGTFLKLDVAPGGTTTLTLRMPAKVALRSGYQGAVTVERGPLVFSLKVGTEWKKRKNSRPFADWEVYPTTPWNYALAVDRDRPERSVRFAERPVGPHPFSQEGAPVVATVQGRRLPGWTLERNAAAPPPTSPVSSAEPLEDLTLIPYGCSDLRVTEFPWLK